MEFTKDFLKAEKEIFINLFGEEEFEKLEKYIKTDLAKQRAKELEKMPYTKRPPSIRAEIDREIYLEQKDMKNKIKEVAKINSISKPEDDFIIDSNLDEDIYPIKNDLKQKNMEKFEDLFKDLEVQNDMTKKFSEIAEKLMNNFVIKANNIDYRLAEIEFYLYEKGKHEDTFIHANVLEEKPNKAAKLQCKMACWYFHYSGIDITFGNKNGRFGGILIRSLVSSLENPTNELVGPLKLKNELLNQYQEIDKSRDFLKLSISKKSLSIVPKHLVRVNLGKSGDQKFREMKYRFILPEIEKWVKKS